MNIKQKRKKCDKIKIKIKITAASAKNKMSDRIDLAIKEYNEKRTEYYEMFCTKITAAKEKYNNIPLNIKITKNPTAKKKYAEKKTKYCKEYYTKLTAANEVYLNELKKNDVRLYI